MEEEKSLEEKFPAMYLVYEHAVKSYDISTKDSDAVDNSIDKLRTFITTVNFAFFALMIPKIPMMLNKNYWLFASLLIYVLIIIVSILAKSTCGIIIPNPQDLYKKYAGYTIWEFRNTFSYWAGEHFMKNRKMIAYKSAFQICIFILFLLEATTMIQWLIQLHV